jgi:predicted nucleic acid-binding protein
MTVLFDASVFVAAFLPTHESHGGSLRWLAAVKAGAVSLVVAAHTLAEIYSTLTRMPPKFALAPQHAWRLIETESV